MAYIVPGHSNKYKILWHFGKNFAALSRGTWSRWSAGTHAAFEVLSLRTMQSRTRLRRKKKGTPDISERREPAISRFNGELKTR